MAARGFRDGALIPFRPAHHAEYTGENHNFDNS
jgi:hypothetical protein